MELIAARSLNNVIGRDTEIPWHAKGEQKLFKEITMGSVLIMGRKTFESIGRPLPGRTTVILTREVGYSQSDCQVFNSLEDALDEFNGDKVFVAGGGEIYAQALPLARGVHLTTVQCEVKGNIFFPPFPTDDFKLVAEQYFDSNIDYYYQHFERIQ